MVKGYSRVQILLHWVVAALIIFQIVGHEPMADAWGVVETGGTPVMSVMVWGHINAGIAVLLLVLWRIGLRLSRGAPLAPAGPAPIRWAGKITHLALYGLMVLVPLSGMAAWFGGVAAAAEAHEVMKNLILILVLLHVGAALYHQFLVKDGLMDRMRKPLD
jgi:cytochrome b561